MSYERSGVFADSVAASRIALHHIAHLHTEGTCAYVCVCCVACGSSRALLAQAKAKDLAAQLKAAQERAAALEVEHREGQAALARVHRDARQQEADMDVQRAQHEVRRRRCRW